MTAHNVAAEGCRAVIDVPYVGIHIVLAIDRVDVVVQAQLRMVDDVEEQKVGRLALLVRENRD